VRGLWKEAGRKLSGNVMNMGAGNDRASLALAGTYIHEFASRQRERQRDRRNHHFSLESTQINSPSIHLPSPSPFDRSSNQTVNLGLTLGYVRVSYNASTMSLLLFVIQGPSFV
jgi:hypothetical protein